MIPIAFYAPLKDPDDPVPSGDRTMARLFLEALGRAGFDPQVASRLRSRDGTGDPARQAAIAGDAVREADRIVAEAEALPGRRPCLWFTYHSYYKAPDHIGPAVARRLGIPYVVAEASRARKRAAGPWAAGHAAAETALAAAARIVCLTAHDREALAADPALAGRLVNLPPFTDAAPSPPDGEVAGPKGLTEGVSRRPERARPHPGRASRPRSALPSGEGEAARLIAVGMMREGDKLASYRLLADALARIADRPWHLDIVGDGPARRSVEVAFAPFRDRTTFHGALARDAVRALYGGSDLLVWPAVNEAFGMALLEAQAAGCPVVAGAYGGVADACQAGRTAILCPPDDMSAFAAAVADLLDDPVRLTRMGRDAARFVATERSLEGAAAILGATLRPLLAASMAAA